MVSIKDIKSTADTYNSPEEVAIRKEGLSKDQVRRIKERLLLEAKYFGRYECSTVVALFPSSNEDKLTDEARSILEGEGFYVKPATISGHWLIGVTIPSTIEESSDVPATEVKDTRPTEFSWFRAPSYRFISGLYIIAAIMFIIATIAAYLYGNILVFSLNIVSTIFMIICAAAYVNMKNYLD